MRTSAAVAGRNESTPRMPIGPTQTPLSPQGISTATAVPISSSPLRSVEGRRYKVSWFEGSAHPRAGPWTEHLVAADVETVVHFVGAADFDGDGRTDIVTAQMPQGADPDNVTLYLNRGTRQAGRWTEAWIPQVLSQDGSHSMRVVDVDGDGRPDLFGANWRAHQRDEHVKLWLNRPLSR